MDRIGMIPGIYTIVNMKSNKAYVGSTQDFEGRWYGHRSALHKGKHCNFHLQSSWNKYGEDAFEFMVCEYVNDPERLIDREQYWLDFHRMYIDVYNIAMVAGSSMRGRTHTEEARRKISVARRGRKLGPMSEETKYKIRKARARQKCGPRSEETKQRISKTLTGRKLGPRSEKHKRNLSKAAMGHTVSEETRYKIAEASRGNQNSLGHKHSEETKQKISKAKLGHTVSDETRRKMSKSAKARWARIRDIL